MSDEKREAGFHGITKDHDVSLQDELTILDKSFSDILRELTSDEDVHKQLARLDKKIRDALAKVYTDFRQLEKEYEKYEHRLNHVCALKNINPNECLSRIPELISMRNRLNAHMNKIYADLNSHSLDSYNALYHELELDDSHKKAIAYMADLIHNTFGSMSLAISTQFQKKSLEELAEKIQNSVS